MARSASTMRLCLAWWWASKAILIEASTGSVSACSSKTAAGVIDCATQRRQRRLWHRPRTCRLRVRQSARVRERRVCWAHETATVTETCDGTKCPKSRMCLHLIAPRLLQRPTVGRPGVDLSGASFRIGCFGSNTSTCNSTTHPARTASNGGRSAEFPLLLHPMSRKHWCRSPARRLELSVQLGAEPLVG